MSIILFFSLMIYFFKSSVFLWLPAAGATTNVLLRLIKFYLLSSCQNRILSFFIGNFSRVRNSFRGWLISFLPWLTSTKKQRISGDAFTRVAFVFFYFPATPQWCEMCTACHLNWILFILLLIFVLWSCVLSRVVNAKEHESRSSSMSPSDFLDSLMGRTSGYDARIRPNFKGALNIHHLCLSSRCPPLPPRPPTTKPSPSVIIFSPHLFFKSSISRATQADSSPSEDPWLLSPEKIECWQCLHSNNQSKFSWQQQDCPASWLQWHHWW